MSGRDQGFYLYVITAGTLDDHNFSTLGPQLLAGLTSIARIGATAIQVREKRLSAGRTIGFVAELVRLVRPYRTQVFVNDRPDVAAAANADGVHLTSNSIPAAAVRRVFGSDLKIAVSTHSEPEVRAASEGLADLIVFGPVFETPGKGEPKGLDAVGRMAAIASPTPLIALGGIDENNCRSVRDAGAAGVAGIRSFIHPERFEAICRSFR